MKAKTIEENQFFNMKSKKKLKQILFFDDNKYIKNQYAIYCIDDGKRLIEEPRGHLLHLHKRIFKFLNQIELPEYVFSSVKGKSHKDNALFHIDNDYVVALDISKYFPKCNDVFVYKFYRYKLHMSHDNAKLMTEISTINITDADLNKNVLQWYTNVNKNLKYPIPCNHIPTGSCLSQKLSFLSYKDMFDEIYALCESNGIKMSVYVDDVVLSRNRKISKKFVKRIINIFNKYGHEVNHNKVKYYGQDSIKRITGIYINKKKELKAPSKHHLEAHEMIIDYGKDNCINNLDSLIGKLRYINSIEKDKFNNILYSLTQTKK